MINANELRIGNWLLNNKNNQPFPVTSIEFDWFYNIRYESISHTKQECDPIPITPEILEQCGFEQTKVDDGDRCLRLRYYNGIAEIFFTYFYDSETQAVSIFYKRDLIGTLVYNLHQLQNLYFALTGCELNIQL